MGGNQSDHHAHQDLDHLSPGAPGHGWPHYIQLDKEEKTAERVMVPVSSTVIPLEDLPELQVGFGFGIASKDKAKKPAYLKDIKLITSKNRHRFVAPGGVKQLTKEEFEAFTNQV